MTYGPFCLLGSGLLFGCSRVAPSRFIVAVAPCAWAIEGMHAELVDLLHLVDPIRVHPIGAIVSRFRHFRQPQTSAEHVTEVIVALRASAIGRRACRGRFVWRVPRRRVP